MIPNVYPNDDPDTAAKKIAENLKKEGLRVISKRKNQATTTRQTEVRKLTIVLWLCYNAF